MPNCRYASDEEGLCWDEAKWVLRRKGFDPHRNRVPVCEEHKDHMMNSPDVELDYEIQGRVGEIPLHQEDDGGA